MRKVPAGLAVVAMATVGVVAASAAPVNKLTSKATVNHTGSKAKPAAFAGTFTFDQSDSGGLRPPPPDYWRWSWNGVQANGSHFPKCTVQQIDAKQSESACPKGSLVASFTGIKALVGPSNDRTVLGAQCNGKRIDVFANGPAQATLIIVGPAEQCAGVGYLPPSPATLTTKNGTTEFSFKWPENLVHALPGVDGALISGTATFPVRKAKDGTPYLTSSSCAGGKRTLTFKLLDENGTTKLPASAGACKK